MDEVPLTGAAAEDPDAYPGLASDPDADRLDRPAGAALHLRPAAIGLVAAGGVVGTALRATVARLGTVAGSTVWVTVLINVVGAFLLGLLLETLSSLGADRGRRRQLRLLLGTGVLGGFTTYSAFAVDVARLGADAVLPAVVVAAVTLLLGVVASALGIAIGAALGHVRRRRSEAA